MIIGVQYKELLDQAKQYKTVNGIKVLGEVKWDYKNKVINCLSCTIYDGVLGEWVENL